MSLDLAERDLAVDVRGESLLGVRLLEGLAPGDRGELDPPSQGDSLRRRCQPVKGGTRNDWSSLLGMLRKLPCHIQQRNA